MTGINLKLSLSCKYGLCVCFSQVKQRKSSSPGRRGRCTRAAECGPSGLLRHTRASRWMHIYYGAREERRQKNCGRDPSVTLRASNVSRTRRFWGWSLPLTWNHNTISQEGAVCFWAERSESWTQAAERRVSDGWATGQGRHLVDKQRTAYENNSAAKTTPSFLFYTK